MERVNVSVVKEMVMCCCGKAVCMNTVCLSYALYT